LEAKGEMHADDPDPVYSDDERAADSVYRALAIAGFQSVIIVGERMGQYYEPPCIQIGKVSRERALRACAVAEGALQVEHYQVSLDQDWRYRSDDDWRHWDNWDEEEPTHYVLTISPEGYRAY
jgi:hypothetical protein